MSEKVIPYSMCAGGLNGNQQFYIDGNSYTIKFYYLQKAVIFNAWGEAVKVIDINENYLNKHELDIEPYYLDWLFNFGCETEEDEEEVYQQICRCHEVDQNTGLDQYDTAIIFGALYDYCYDNNEPLYLMFSDETDALNFSSYYKGEFVGVMPGSNQSLVRLDWYYD